MVAHRRPQLTANAAHGGSFLSAHPSSCQWPIFIEDWASSTRSKDRSHQDVYNPLKKDSLPLEDSSVRTRMMLYHLVHVPCLWWHGVYPKKNQLARKERFLSATNKLLTSVSIEFFFWTFNLHHKVLQFKPPPEPIARRYESQAWSLLIAPPYEEIHANCRRRYYMGGWKHQIFVDDYQSIHQRPKGPRLRIFGKIVWISLTVEHSASLIPP